jgi:hypothetical protein
MINIDGARIGRVTFDINGDDALRLDIRCHEQRRSVVAEVGWRNRWMGETAPPRRPGS